MELTLSLRAHVETASPESLYLKRDIRCIGATKEMTVQHIFKTVTGHDFAPMWYFDPTTRSYKMLTGAKMNSCVVRYEEVFISGSQHTLEGQTTLEALRHRDPHIICSVSIPYSS